MCSCSFVPVLCKHTHSGQAWSINGAFAQSSKCQGPAALRGSHLFLSVFLVSLLHESSHVNREKRIKTKEQTTIAQLCLLQSSSKRGTLQQRPQPGTCDPQARRHVSCLSRRQHSPKLDSPDSSGVWATLLVAAAVVIKSSNREILLEWLAAEPQRVVFSLTPFSAAQHRCISLRAGPASCRRSNASASFQETKTPNQIWHV